VDTFLGLYCLADVPGPPWDCPVTLPTRSLQSLTWGLCQDLELTLSLIFCAHYRTVCGEAAGVGRSVIALDRLVKIDCPVPMTQVS
jgi:hypothetical protein